jgi:hypothetical protein
VLSFSSIGNGGDIAVACPERIRIRRTYNADTHWSLRTPSSPIEQPRSLQSPAQCVKYKYEPKQHIPPSSSSSQTLKPKMVSKLLTLALTTALLGILYQLLLRDIIFIFIGVGRNYNRIEDFDYECRRLRDPLLESCEDLVLDTGGRRVAACSTLRSREGWAPKLVLVI